MSMTPERKLFLMKNIWMSLLMAIILSAFMLYINVGISEQFFQQWLKGFIISWPVAFVLAIVLDRPSSAIAHKLIDHP